MSGPPSALLPVHPASFCAIAVLGLEASPEPCVELVSVAVLGGGAVGGGRRAGEGGTEGERVAWAEDRRAGKEMLPAVQEWRPGRQAALTPRDAALCPGDVLTTSFICLVNAHLVSSLL